MEPADVTGQYRVHLPVFQGPIELLLALIEGQRLEITSVSLAAVADQFLEYLQTRSELDAAEMAAFVEVAARLLVIKSRALLPRPNASTDEEDIAADLVRQLQEYRRYRAAAQALSARWQSGCVLYPRQCITPGMISLICRPQEVNKLPKTMRRFAAVIEASADSEEGLPAQLAFRIVSKLKLILRSVFNRGSVLFSELIKGATHRTEVLATFLALLELVRRRRITAEQPSLFSDISISRCPETAVLLPAQESQPVDALERIC